MTVGKLLEEFPEYLTNILSKYKLSIVMDGFNIHMKKPDLADTQAFADMCESLNILQYVHISPHTGMGIYWT